MWPSAQGEAGQEATGHSKATATAPAPGGTGSCPRIVPLCPEATFSGPWGFRPPRCCYIGRVFPGSGTDGGLTPEPMGADPRRGLQSALPRPGPSCRVESQPEPGAASARGRRDPVSPCITHHACLSREMVLSPGATFLQGQGASGPLPRLSLPPGSSRCPSLWWR